MMPNPSTRRVSSRAELGQEGRSQPATNRSRVCCFQGKITVMSRVVLCLVLVLGHGVLARGHELPDGVIERRVQISVKPDGVLVQYSLSMNGTTLERELRKHRKKPAETYPAMWKQYEEIILPSIPKHMRLTIEGQRFPLKPIRAEYSGWSHQQLTCLLKAEVPFTEQLKKVVVTDGNFLDTPGSYRIAMKDRSGVTMENSTVATMVTRAKSVDLSKLTEPEKQAATRAQGEFALEQRQ